MGAPEARREAGGRGIPGDAGGRGVPRVANRDGSNHAERPSTGGRTGHAQASCTARPWTRTTRRGRPGQRPERARSGRARRAERLSSRDCHPAAEPAGRDRSACFERSGFGVGGRPDPEGRPRGGHGRAEPSGRGIPPEESPALTVDRARGYTPAGAVPRGPRPSSFASRGQHSPWTTVPVAAAPGAPRNPGSPSAPPPDG